MVLQTEIGQLGESITVINVQWRDGTIVPNGSLQEYRSAVEDQYLLIFRSVFDGAEIIALRRAVQRWAESVAPFPKGQSASRPDLNFHRLDDDSAPTSMPHVFHQFGFANLANLPRELSETVTTISTAMLNLQNELAGTKFKLDGHGLRTKIMRHPRGGGFLVPHRHPYQPQRVSLFLNLSQPGIDYSSGGIAFKARGTLLDAFQHFRLGDILAWRYDMIHEIQPIDPGGPQKWEGDDGYWIYALEMEDTHKRSNAAK